MRSFALGILLLFASLHPASARPSDVIVGPVHLQLGMSEAEARQALPAGYRLENGRSFQIVGESGHAGRYADIFSGENSRRAILWVTFEHERLTRATRLVDRADYTAEGAPVLTRAVVAALATWPQSEPIRSEAKTFGEGTDRLMELRFIQGERQLILTETSRRVQLVENFGRGDVEASGLPQ